MRAIDKHSARLLKSKAYADFLRRVKETYTWFMTTPVSIFNCLSQARLNEKSAAAAERSREMLRLETPPVEPPPELSDQTIAKYYLQAARMYEAAAIYSVLRQDLCRAFKRFRNAARCGGRCDEFLVRSDPETPSAAEDYREKTALLRYEIARRSVRRKKLTLGLGGRLR